jgi:hypothetical protein
MIKVPEKLIEETKAMVRLFLSLRYEVGLKEADKLSVEALKVLLKGINEEDSIRDENA